MTRATETARIAVLANAEACLRWLDRGPDLDAASRSVKWIIECILAAGSRVGSIKKLVILLRAYSCPTRSAPQSDSQMAVQGPIQQLYVRGSNLEKSELSS